MYFISHRGNLNGRIPNKENNPSYIIKAIDAGFDVEIDLWKLGDNLYLGHDAPKYEISLNFLINLRYNLWIHTKNRLALEYLNQFCVNNDRMLNYFWHDKDSYVLTSKGYVWCHSGSIKLKNSIWVMPELSKPSGYMVDPKILDGVCSDNIVFYRQAFLTTIEGRVFCRNQN